MATENAVYDYSWAKPSFGGEKIGGVIRYLSHDSSKDITLAEYQGLRFFNVPVGLVWETSAGRATEGWLAGVADGKEANARADALGYPHDAVIFYACDESAKGNDDVVLYMAGVTYAGGRPIGFYGGDNPGATILYKGFARYFWQAAASSWSDHFPSPYACLVQQVGSDIDGTDLNVVQAPWGGDGAEKRPEPEAPVPAPPETPSEENGSGPVQVPGPPSTDDIVAKNVLPRLDTLEHIEAIDADRITKLENANRDLLTTLEVQAKRLNRLEAALREGTLQVRWSRARVALRARLARVLDA